MPAHNWHFSLKALFKIIMEQIISNQYPIHQDEISELIKQLLDKTEDRNMKVDLYGYPSDYLTDPLRSIKKILTNEGITYKASGSMSFMVLSTLGNEIIVGGALQSPGKSLILDFGMRKAWINKQKLKSLINLHVSNGFMYSTNDGDGFYVKLPIQLLLDHSEKIL